MIDIKKLEVGHEVMVEFMPFPFIVKEILEHTIPHNYTIFYNIIIENIEVGKKIEVALEELSFSEKQIRDFKLNKLGIRD